MLQEALFPDLDRDGAPASVPAVEVYGQSQRGAALSRIVITRSGEKVDSNVKSAGPVVGGDWHAAYDAAWLRASKPPSRPASRGTVRLVDLFSGCGALSLGISEACRALALDLEHVFAADSNGRALSVYQKNFPTLLTSHAPIESMVQAFDAPTSRGEKELQSTLGDIDVLAGGPPCQGHSDLNNHTRRSDSRNSLFDTVIRFVQLLRPPHVIIENVPGVRHDRGGVTQRSRRDLEALGYSVSEALLTASHFGVAQRRRRYFMIASRQSGFVFAGLTRVEKERSLRWACGDLADVSSDLVIDSSAVSSRANRDRIDYLFQHDIYDLPDSVRPPCHSLKKHSYRAVYGRLRWDEAAPTITSGFNSPGQGRFVHPQMARTLTPREAARVQFLPDFFDWGDSNRESLTQMIGNAVPPKLAYAVALELLR
jgi:DNA (cytosine-5)-methyltransferase 1